MSNGVLEEINIALRDDSLEPSVYQRLSLLANRAILEQLEGQDTRIKKNTNDITKMQMPIRLITWFGSAFLPFLLALIWSLITGQAQLVFL